MPTLEVITENGMWKIKLTTSIPNCSFTEAVSPDLTCALVETEMGFLGYRPFHKAKEPIKVVLKGTIPEMDLTQIRKVFDSYARELDVRTVYNQV